MGLFANSMMLMSSSARYIALVLLIDACLFLLSKNFI